MSTYNGIRSVRLLDSCTFPTKIWINYQYWRCLFSTRTSSYCTVFFTVSPKKLKNTKTFNIANLKLALKKNLRFSLHIWQVYAEQNYQYLKMFWGVKNKKQNHFYIWSQNRSWSPRPEPTKTDRRRNTGFQKAGTFCTGEWRHFAMGHLHKFWNRL